MVDYVGIRIRYIFLLRTFRIMSNVVLVSHQSQTTRSNTRCTIFGIGLRGLAQDLYTPSIGPLRDLDLNSILPCIEISTGFKLNAFAVEIINVTHLGVVLWPTLC